MRSVQESGTLPLMEESILSVGIGCVQIKHAKSQKVPENYQVSLNISYQQPIFPSHMNPLNDVSSSVQLEATSLVPSFWFICVE